MSYFSGTFPKKFCRSDDHRPSNKPEPLYNDFWDTLYLCVCNLFFNFELNFLIFLEIRCDDAGIIIYYLLFIYLFIYFQVWPMGGVNKGHLGGLD